jgi:hypothetical protein
MGIDVDIFYKNDTKIEFNGVKSILCSLRDITPRYSFITNSKSKVRFLGEQMGIDFFKLKDYHRFFEFDSKKYFKFKSKVIKKVKKLKQFDSNDLLHFNEFFLYLEHFMHDKILDCKDKIYFRFDW